MITQYLPLAVADGENLEARSQMLAASMMGAVAFLMAEFVGVPYAKIITIAIIRA